MRKKTKAGLGVEAAKGIITDPDIRSAAAEAAPPVARLSLNVGKRLARRRTRKQLEQIGETINSLAGLLATYGPMVAQQLGAVEPPRQKRTAPRVATGVVIGATTMYVLKPKLPQRH
jgi:hypothetical protein